MSPNELRLLEEKLQQATELIFEVEHAFDVHAPGEEGERLKAYFNHYGYTARIKIGDLDHQLKVMRGIRK